MSERDGTWQSVAGDWQHELLVYAMSNCPGWSAASSLVALIQAANVSGLDVRVVELSAPEAPVPNFVVASPTWALDGRLISLGNPDPDWLLARVASLQEGD